MSTIHVPAQVTSHRRSQGRVGVAARTVAALLMFAVVFARIGGVARLDFNAPLHYSDDALETLSYLDRAYIANDLDTRLRAPFELERREPWRYVYNALQRSNSNLLWATYIIGRNVVRAMTFYYMATFVLIFFSAYWVLGRLGMPDPFRFGAATLYSLMPHHFQRGIDHLSEASYFLIPLLIFLLLELWAARPLGHRAGPTGWRFDPRDRRVYLILGFLLLVSPWNPYHPFFFAILAVLTAPLAGWYRRSWRPVVIGGCLASIAVLPLIVQPVLERSLAEPQLALSVTGESVAGYGEAESYPLKIVQLVLPVQGHRSAFLAGIRALYDAKHPLNNENSTTSLGFVGSVGLFICLVVPLLPSKRSAFSTLRKAGLIVLICVLIATMGGIGSMISTLSNAAFGPTFPLTAARGWNRMVIFIGFFAYFAAFRALHDGIRCLRQRYLPALPGPLIAWPAFAAVLAFALWDQVASPLRQQDVGKYYSDLRFFNQIESEIPGGSRVFQYPFVLHHLSGWLQGIYYTDELRPYLASRSLHITYGADRDTPQALWYEAATKLEPSQQAPYLCLYGFAGFLLHRNMVSNAESIEHEWQAQAEVAPKMSQDAQLSFFDLRSYCKRHGIQPLDLGPIRARLMQQVSDRSAIFMNAANLPSTIGQLQVETDGSISRIVGHDAEGVVTYTPDRLLPSGRYRAVFDVAVHGEGSVSLDVLAQRKEEPILLAQTTMDAVAGRSSKSMEFEVMPDDKHLEFRVHKRRGPAVQMFCIEVHPVR